MPQFRPVIEVDHYQARKHGQEACGDVFHCTQAEGNRVISVLADGLGSGIKANVLANLTATMVAKYVSMDVDITRAASIIMATLPVCSVRQIAYSTFTIVDMDRRGVTRIVEFDNPPCVILRGQRFLDLPKEKFTLTGLSGRPVELWHLTFRAEPGDRIVVFSDGVTQAGVGLKGTPLGWGQNAVRDLLARQLNLQPNAGARHLARQVVMQALACDGHRAKDDITCGVVSYRRPRELLLLTGPPVSRERDRKLADMARNFEGRKVICGGTTANIMARELGLEMRMDLTVLDPEVPPFCTMDGFDLVTEGAITLARVTRLLEEEENLDALKPNAATMLAGMLLDSDIVHILAGTKINEALQDPNLPQELDIRRNILRRLQTVLTTRHIKEVQLRFI